MLKNQLKVAWRYLIRNKVYSLIYITGLAIGLAVSLIDGLWIFDEISYNKAHDNYDRIAKVMSHVGYNGEKITTFWTPSPLGNTLKNNFPNDFKRVVTSTYPGSHVLSFQESNVSKEGCFMQPTAPDMLSLKMLKGTRAGLLDQYSILISESLAKIFFPNIDPINKIIKVDNQENVKVTGVYQDLPNNSEFNKLFFILPWDLFLSRSGLGRGVPESWTNNSYVTYVEVADNSKMDNISAKIRDVITNKLDAAGRQNNLDYKPQVFLHPMSQWHLYSEFKNGFNVGGKIQYVWLFGIIGAFVLLLACINFMNLTTARSQIRAKEIGIRKTIGSSRSLIISQFFSETFLIVLFSYLIAIGLVIVLLPFFNQIADKNLTVLWGSVWFWLLNIVCCLATCFLAGIYPALFLSSFKPVQVLKGTFKIGGASFQRKILIVIQFTVSIVLIIGTLVVYRQIQYAKSRPIGYSKNGLITIGITPEIRNNLGIISDELRKTGAVSKIAKSVNPTTEYFAISSSLKWEGKDPKITIPFALDNISNNYGKTINWKIINGRDFSADFLSDSSSCILNESAAKVLGVAGNIGKSVEFQGKSYSVIGVVKDLLVESPYKAPMPSVFFMTEKLGYITLIIKLNDKAGLKTEIDEIAGVFKKYNPSVPFDFKFVDEQYEKKFNDEIRIGKLSTFLTILAIFISCLGLYGLSAFVVQQRAKEFGIRKVLGASVLSIWKLLITNFMLLVTISLFISIPTSYYFMHNWLENYSYRTQIPWYLYAIAGISALLIVLFVVSFQAIKAGLTKAVNSLRSE